MTKEERLKHLLSRLEKTWVPSIWQEYFTMWLKYQFAKSDAQVERENEQRNLGSQ
jgi:hypothetical protein